MPNTAQDDDAYDEEDAGPWQAVPPLYLLRTAESCPACGTPQHVYALGCRDFREAGEASRTPIFHFLHHIERLPGNLLALLESKCPGYFLDRAEDFPRPYLMNHCRCGARLADDYLHGEVGAAFFPDMPEGYGHLQLFTLPVDGPVPVVASYCVGGDEYLEFAKAEPW